MAYTITLTDGTTLGTVPEREAVTTLAPVTFIGRNLPNWGDEYNNTLVRMVEHFRSTNAPGSTLRGQLWFDPSGAPTTVPLIPPLDFGGVIPKLKFNVNPNAGAPIWWEVAHAINGTIHAAAAVIGNIFSTGEFSGTATRARYADLAERFEAHPEQDIRPGDVVELGGPAEIQLTSGDATAAVFGVVSTKPGFMMNDGAGEDGTHPFVALAGRVPCRVVGPVAFGDKLVASRMPGVARARRSGDPIEAVFGRALGRWGKETEGKIEVVVGAR